jgi:uroporphyrinogen-III decarboxylase
LKTWSSRDRLLAVLRRERPDHIPLLFNTFGFRPPFDVLWDSQADEARFWLSHGVDDWLTVHVEQAFQPDVRVRRWEERIQGERWPLMVAEYETPAGPLRQEVWRTDDWTSPDWPGHKDGEPHVALLDDYNPPRSRRFAVETEADVERARYLFAEPSADASARFREQAARLASQARELDVLLVGWGPGGGDLAVWLCGVTGMLLMAKERPAVFEALMEVIHAWDRRQTELLLDAGVDMVIRRGYYEGATFWSPALFRRFFAPRIRELADLAHGAGRFLGYIMSVGYDPLLPDLAAIGYDAHYLLDPIWQGRHADLSRVREFFGGKTAVIGGLNEPVTLEFGSREDIRREVFRAVEQLGPDGLALTPAEGIMASTPWSAIETLIEAWREVR